MYFKQRSQRLILGKFMNLFHIDNQPDPNAETSPIVFGQAEQNRLQRENDRAREAALAQRAAVLAEINHCSIEEVQEVLSIRQRNRTEALQRRVQAKLAAASRMVIGTPGGEPARMAPYLPKSPAMVAIPASDGETLEVPKERFKHLFGIK